VPYILFVTTRNPRVVAAVLYTEDGKLYFATSKDLKKAFHDILLSSPFIDRDSKRILVFKVGGRTVKATAYEVKVTRAYELDLFAEEVRYLASDLLGDYVRVVMIKTKAEEKGEKGKASEDEGKVYEVVPDNIPPEILEEAEGERGER
jgi:hypothetical protein